MSPITEAVLTVDAVHGPEEAVKLLCELIGELERAFDVRDSKEKERP